MKILAIETSCDETAIAIVEGFLVEENHARFSVLGNVLYSQADKHAEFGGVFPDLARREHVKNILPILKVTTEKAGIKEIKSKAEEKTKEQIKEWLEREPELANELIEFATTHRFEDSEFKGLDAIAVTAGPGLEPALWVGINVARALAILWELPLIGVNHMHGHALSSLFPNHKLNTPALALLVSGGHTEIDLVKSPTEITCIGSTRDDAAGEAFDKVARLLNLPYPGGPEVSKLAAKHRQENPDWRSMFNLPQPMRNSPDFDFSFSGLKTAVMYRLKEIELTQENKEILAREFEDAVAEILVYKLQKAIEEYNPQQVLTGGGVLANSYLRQSLEKMAQKHNVEVLLPAPELATDNALMIAQAAFWNLQAGITTNPNEIRAKGNMKFQI